MVVFEHPETFLLFLPIAILVLFVWRRDIGKATPRRLLSPLLRLAILALVLAAVAGPAREVDDVVPRRLVLLLDESRSVSPQAREKGIETLRATRVADPDADLVFIGFAGGSRRLPWPVEVADVDDTDASATDIASALSAALAAGETGTFLRVVLASDGQATRGDARTSAAALRRAGAVVDVHPLPGPPERRENPGPRILALDAPTEGDASAPLRVKALVDLAGVEAATVVLRANGEEIARAVASTDRGMEITVVFPPTALGEGSHLLSAALADDPEVSVRRAIRVRPGPRALAIRQRASRGPIETALDVSGIPVVVVGPEDLRKTLESAGPADVILKECGESLAPLVANLPELVGALGRGASLVITDGTNLATARETPLLPYLPLIPDALPPPTSTPDPPGPEKPPGPGTALENVEKKALRVSLLLIVDTSGSMRGEKIAMARRAAWEATQALDERDLIGVIGFSDEPYWVLGPTPAGDRRRIRAGLARIMARGGTDIYEALREAFSAFRRQNVAIRHAILLTDGHSAEAPFRGLVQKATAERITLSTIAIGPDADTRLLTDLATVWGRGVFQWAQTAAEIPRYVTADTKRVIQEGRGEPLADGASADERPDRPVPEPSRPDAPPLSEIPPEPIRVAAPHPAMAGIAPDSVPDLGGIVPCRARAAAWISLETETDARPVLAEWRVGLGRVLVLAADLEKPGASLWGRWPEFAGFWTQAVRALAASSGPSAGPMVDVRWTPDAVEVSASTPTGTGRPSLAIIEGEETRVLAAGEAGAARATLERGEVARTVLVKAATDRGGVHAIAIDIPARTDPETAASGTNVPRLKALADAAGGRFDPSPEDVPEAPLRRRSEPLEAWFLLAAALLLPIDVAVRRSLR
jgi:Ca-activated chloride channel homolog